MRTRLGLRCRDFRRSELDSVCATENEAGKPQYEAWLKADRESQIEQVGARLRERMAWLNTPKAEAA